MHDKITILNKVIDYLLPRLEHRIPKNNANRVLKQMKNKRSK